MIGLFRRIGFALVIAAGTARVLRFSKPPDSPRQHGGWRVLDGPGFR